MSVSVMYVLYSHLCLQVYVFVHSPEKSMMCYSPLSYSLDTQSLIEPGAGQAGKKPQGSSCLNLPQCWGHRHLRVHTRLLTWVLGSTLRPPFLCVNTPAHKAISLPAGLIFERESHYVAQAGLKLLIESTIA